MKEECVIKNCPFCGGSSELVEKHEYNYFTENCFDYWVVQCKKCKIATAQYVGWKTALKRWNNRVEENK